MKHCEEVLRNVNWKLLREQKEYIVSEACDNMNTEVFEGLISLIDRLQDAAVLDGVATEVEVFGETRES